MSTEEPKESADTTNPDDLPMINKVYNSTKEMASTYFTLPSFTRAKRNQEQLRKSNPQVPVLKDDDEKFLEQQIASSTLPDDVPKTKITDDGKEKPATPSDLKADAVVVPDTQTGDKEASSPKTSKKDFGLPSQEEAEAATKNWDAAFEKSQKSGDASSSAEKRTWASYLIPGSKKDSKTAGEASAVASDEKANEDSGSKTPQRTWAEYANSYVPSNLPSMPTLPSTLTFKKSSKSDPDAHASPVLKEDGTIDDAATAEKQEREITILLDNMNMSTLNNRVFALSTETQKIYDRFAEVLKDTINGVPTAYDDMDKLMRDAGPTIEKQYKAMPPFVQSLVKTLPAKLSTALAPEVLSSIVAEKPGADLKAADKSKAGASAKGGKSAKGKSKRSVPGLKNLITQQGAVAGILRNVVTFLRVRFPLLASGTNVVMSLAVFILMFVFYYCHKRGKEVRLEKEMAASTASVEADGVADEEDSFTAEDDDDDDVSDEVDADDEKWQARLEQSEPAQVPLPTPKAIDDSKSGEVEKL